MTDDIPLAVVARWGGVRVETRAVVQGSVDAKPAWPGQPVDAWERLGTLPGWPVREMLPCGEGPLGVRVPEVGQERGRQAGKASGRCEGGLGGRDPQQEPSARAQALKAPTASDVTWNPGVPGASGPRAAPQDASSDRSRGDDSTGKGARCPDRLAQDVIWGLAESASL
jgi:hypothetical protein